MHDSANPDCEPRLFFDIIPEAFDPQINKYCVQIITAIRNAVEQEGGVKAFAKKINTPEYEFDFLYDHDKIPSVKIFEQSFPYITKQLAHELVLKIEHELLKMLRNTSEQYQKKEISRGEAREQLIFILKKIESYYEKPEQLFELGQDLGQAASLIQKYSLKVDHDSPL
ncbi:hypothetical protein SDC9_189247 [bioreactor metagenome]|uniref:Uncharacterized protein n=1 Tax=bioreactor metagenome TaxID=1076179 RepID=A0A645HTA3_9ZZZZ